MSQTLLLILILIQKYPLGLSLYRNETIAHWPIFSSVGGCGFLGHHVVRELLEDPSCSSISVMSRSPFKNRYDGVRYYMYVQHLFASTCLRPILVTTLSVFRWLQNGHDRTVIVSTGYRFLCRLKILNWHCASGDITKSAHVDHVVAQTKPNVIFNTASPHAYGKLFQHVS